VIIRSPDVIKKVHKWLDIVGIGGVNPKMYLSAFMMYHWGDDISGVKNSQEKNNSVQEAISWSVRWEAENLFHKYDEICSKKVIKYIDKISHLLAVFKYKKAFLAWKNMDLKSIIDHMCYNYTELENCKGMIGTIRTSENNPENEMILQYIEEQKDKIKEHISSLVGKKNVNKALQTYKPVKISSTFQQMQEIMHKAFWDKVAEDLSKVPPEHKHVINLLKEIKVMIMQLIPNRHDIHADLDKNIDTAFIEQMIVNNAFDHGELETVIRYIATMIHKLQAASEDKDTDKWTKDMVKMCKDMRSWSEIIPSFFKTAFQKVENINITIRRLENEFKPKN